MTRISELPRRSDWREQPEESIRELTDYLRAPGGTQELRLIQVAAILEAVKASGGFINARVGAGKTLIAFLLASLYEDYRPLILIPGGFEEKTERECAEYRKHWNITHKYNLCTYNDLARDQDEQLLTTYAPGVLICDEVDKLRRVKESATARRVATYMAENPRTMFFGMTGTPFKSELKDIAHLLCWGLKEGAPAPLLPIDIERWNRALKGDEGCFGKVFGDLGAKGNTLEELRKEFRERLFQTQGVIISVDQFTGVPLTIHTEEFDAGCGAILRKLTETGERPDGWDTADGEGEDDGDEDPGSTWAAERQIALGFYYTPDPEPPAEWMAARKAWFRFVRNQLKAGFFNTELQVRMAAKRGKFGELKAWLDWERLKPTFEPNFVPVWLTDSAINYCKGWGKRPGIIWTDHRAFASRLSAETGWRWFSSGGLDSSGAPIELASGRETIIASRQACGTGRNLQAWSRGLITAMPGNGRDFEQQLGRQHREGQRNPVDMTVLLACGAHRRDTLKVLNLSEDEREIMGRQNKALTAIWS